MKYMFSEIGTKDTRAKGIYNSDVKRHWNYPRDTESKAIENIAFPSWNNWYENTYENYLLKSGFCYIACPLL